MSRADLRKGAGLGGRRGRVAVAAAAALAGMTIAKDALAGGEPPVVLATGVRVLDEPANAWLHDHCSYRGLHGADPRLIARPGTIAELVSGPGEAIRVKIFRCAERPPFVSGAFEPALREVVACERGEQDEGSGPKTCVAPLVGRANAERRVSLAELGANVVKPIAVVSVVGWAPATATATATAARPGPGQKVARP